MKPALYSILTLMLLFIFLLSGCVSKKKHQEILNNLKTNYQSELDAQSTSYSSQLGEARTNIKELELNLAERKGENNMLLLLRKELEGQVDSLVEAMENQGSQSQSNRQSLRQEINEKDQEIKRLQGLITQIDQTLINLTKMLGNVAGDLRTALANFPQNECDIITSFDEVRVVLSEELMFKGTSATRLGSRGIEALEIFSNIIQRYPSLVVQVTGHTDNRKPANKGYKDNWNYSVLRAASVTRQLIQELDMTPNQVTAASKSEFTPIASNETKEGRQQNKRIELIITPLVRDLAKSIEKLTQQKDKE